MHELPIAARVYVVAVMVAAATLVAAAPMHVDSWAPVVVFAVLFLACDSLPVAAGANTRFSLTVTQPVAIAAFVVLGPWGAVIVAAASLFDIARIPPVKRGFNAAQLCLSAFVGGFVYEAVGGTADLTTHDFPEAILWVLVAGLAYTVANAALVGAIFKFAEMVPTRALLRDVANRVTVPTLAYSALGLLIAVLWQEIGALSLVLVLMPLFVARWAMGQFAAEREAYQATIRALVQAVETKDAYTRGHSERVARASVMIARRLAMNEDRLNAIEYAGTLHDVGKLGVPTSVLTKAGKLTDEEFDAIKTHPVRGHEIVREIEFLDEALAGIFHHHERIDGRGYPMGLSGMDIPEFARVIAVADAFDSMTSTRSYRGARPVDEAVEELIRCQGTQFDPVMVEAMVVAVREEGWAAAVPPTADEIAAANNTFTIDDDDPFVDVRSQVRP